MGCRVQARVEDIWQAAILFTATRDTISISRASWLHPGVCTEWCVQCPPETTRAACCIKNMDAPCGWPFPNELQSRVLSNGTDIYIYMYIIYIYVYIRGIIWGTNIRIIPKSTRSLDYGSNGGPLYVSADLRLSVASWFEKLLGL